METNTLSTLSNGVMETKTLSNGVMETNTLSTLSNGVMEAMERYKDTWRDIERIEGHRSGHRGAQRGTEGHRGAQRDMDM